jgi:hypothetical protein
MEARIRKVLPGVLVLSTILAGIVLIAFLSIIASTSSGCSTPHALYADGTKMSDGTSTWTSQQCQNIYNWEIALTSVDAAIGALAASSGLAAAFPGDPQKALGYTALASGVITAAITVALKMLGDEFSTYCSLTNAGATPVPTGKPFVDKAATAPPTIKQPVGTTRPSPLNPDLDKPDWYKSK